MKKNILMSIRKLIKNILFYATIFFISWLFATLYYMSEFPFIYREKNEKNLQVHIKKLPKVLLLSEYFPNSLQFNI